MLPAPVICSSSLAKSSIPSSSLCHENLPGNALHFLVLNHPGNALHFLGMSSDREGQHFNDGKTKGLLPVTTAVAQAQLFQLGWDLGQALEGRWSGSCALYTCVCQGWAELCCGEPLHSLDDDWGGFVFLFSEPCSGAAGWVGEEGWVFSPCLAVTWSQASMGETSHAVQAWENFKNESFNNGFICRVALYLVVWNANSNTRKKNEKHPVKMLFGIHK